MDRGAWQAIVYGVIRVGHNSVTDHHMMKQNWDMALRVGLPTYISFQISPEMKKRHNSFGQKVEQVVTQKKNHHKSNYKKLYSNIIR